MPPAEVPYTKLYSASLPSPETPGRVNNVRLTGRVKKITLRKAKWPADHHGDAKLSKVFLAIGGLRAHPTGLAAVVVKASEPPSPCLLKGIISALTKRGNVFISDRAATAAMFFCALSNRRACA